ncbi:hypothetical protein [uncultured Psychroserpens sp.]|uniref:hypothetical protein n=1 Tax=uncultured Psychroserpens sp. TaxID=255436 RepID=UPI002612A5A3|nr:hypothetical protein [uncultured Psychroserpens sp.]
MTFLKYLILCSSLLGFSQETVFKFTVNQLNKELNIYATQSAHGAENFAVKDLELSEIEMQIYFEKEEQITSTDSISMYAAISITQSKINALLFILMGNKETAKHDLRHVINDELAIVKSEDNKLYNFSLDQKTGGSYRSRISWMYYLEDHAYIDISSSFDSDDNMNSDSIFFPDGYHDIKTFNSHNKTWYLLFGSVRGCGACFEEYVTLTHFEDNTLQLDFEYSVVSRVAEQRIFYEAFSKSLSVFYDTDDLTTDCYCEDQDLNNRIYEEDDTEDIQESSTYSCSCLFEFSKDTFKLLKQCAERIKG